MLPLCTSAHSTSRHALVHVGVSPITHALRSSAMRFLGDLTGQDIYTHTTYSIHTVNLHLVSAYFPSLSAPHHTCVSKTNKVPCTTPRGADQYIMAMAHAFFPRGSLGESWSRDTPFSRLLAGEENVCADVSVHLRVWKGTGRKVYRVWRKW